MSLFVYDTLRYGPLFTRVAGPGGGSGEPAVLADHAVERAADGPWPAIVARPGARAEGLLLSNLSEAQLARLDAYERPFGFDRRSVTVATAAGPVNATCYFPTDGASSSGLPWSLAAWITADAPAALLAAAEVDWSLAGADPAGLRRRWPMVRMRAAATVRAQATRLPATLRHAAAPGDHHCEESAPPAGAFFRFATLRLDHLRFDGARSGPLPREVLVGADAALVLPYDPGRDRVLLVEQFRAGPARRGDPNPWTLEPVAGIVDADETPEQAAHRETVEEAQLTLSDLRPMFRVYASPGSTTDHFYCFLGLADLPDGHAATGGLAEEAEDLRLHVIPFDRAMALLDSGEITAAPLAAMLLWLARARDGLRRAAAAQP